MCCSPDPTCGNSFNYDDGDACPSSKGPAPSPTLCSTGTNGCDTSLCGAPGKGVVRLLKASYFGPILDTWGKTF